MALAAFRSYTDTFGHNMRNAGQQLIEFCPRQTLLSISLTERFKCSIQFYIEHALMGAKNTALVNKGLNDVASHGKGGQKQFRILWQREFKTTFD